MGEPLLNPMLIELEALPPPSTEPPLRSDKFWVGQLHVEWLYRVQLDVGLP